MALAAVIKEAKEAMKKVFLNDNLDKLNLIKDELTTKQRG